MVDYTIEHLADRPDCINACAAWAYGRWGVQMPNGSLERALELFKESSQKQKVPFTLVAINKETNLPIAMVSVWKKDSDDWPDHTPWIASVYTLYRYRGQSIAKKLIAKAEEVAAELGVEKIYLQSGSAESYYPKLGYEKLDKIKTNTTAAGTRTLFCKELKT